MSKIKKLQQTEKRLKKKLKKVRRKINKYYERRTAVFGVINAAPLRMPLEMVNVFEMLSAQTAQRESDEFPELISDKE